MNDEEINKKTVNGRKIGDKSKKIPRLNSKREMANGKIDIH
jgi:hypothetical protein